MLIPILAVIAAAIAVLIVVIAMQSPQLNVTRSLKMAAPAEAVFPHVNDFRKWAAWSPYDKIDPAMKRTYEGAASGVGAIYSWEGNKKAGAGKMTIQESKPGESIRMKLEFFAPMRAVSAAIFEFKPAGGQTEVTWRMESTKPFMSKAVGLFVNLDQLIGRDFEKGLASLKALAESGAKR